MSKCIKNKITAVFAVITVIDFTYLASLSGSMHQFVYSPLPLLLFFPVYFLFRYLWTQEKDLRMKVITWVFGFLFSLSVIMGYVLEYKGTLKYFRGGVYGFSHPSNAAVRRLL